MTVFRIFQKRGIDFSKTYSEFQMLVFFLLAIQCHGLVEDSRFKVTKCSTDDGQPELTFTIDKEYFEQNLSWQADQEGFEVVIKSPP